MSAQSTGSANIESPVPPTATTTAAEQPATILPRTTAINEQPAPLLQRAAPYSAPNTSAAPRPATPTVPVSTPPVSVAAAANAYYQQQLLMQVAQQAQRTSTASPTKGAPLPTRPGSAATSTNTAAAAASIPTTSEMTTTAYPAHAAAALSYASHYPYFQQATQANQKIFMQSSYALSAAAAQQPTSLQNLFLQSSAAGSSQNQIFSYSVMLAAAAAAVAASSPGNNLSSSGGNGSSLPASMAPDVGGKITIGDIKNPGLLPQSASLAATAAAISASASSQQAQITRMAAANAAAKRQRMLAGSNTPLAAAASSSASSAAAAATGVPAIATQIATEQNDLFFQQRKRFSTETHMAQSPKRSSTTGPLLPPKPQSQLLPPPPPPPPREPGPASFASKHAALQAPQGPVDDRCLVLSAAMSARLQSTLAKCTSGGQPLGFTDQVAKYIALALEQRIKDLLARMMRLCSHRQCEAPVSASGAEFQKGHYSLTLVDAPDTALKLLQRRDSLLFDDGKSTNGGTAAAPCSGAGDGGGVGSPDGMAGVRTPGVSGAAKPTRVHNTRQSGATAFYAAGGSVRSWMSVDSHEESMGGAEAARESGSGRFRRAGSKAFSARAASSGVIVPGTGVGAGALPLPRVRRITMREALLVLDSEHTTGSGRHNATGVGSTSTKMWARLKERPVLN